VQDVLKEDRRIMALERLNLDGQVALVTGAGRGVGRGIACVLAEAGATVVATARTPDQIQATAASIVDAGGRALAVVGDAMKRADNERLVRAALDAFGRIDIVVNNAGGGKGGSFADLSEDDLAFAFGWNTLSSFTLTQIAAPHMLKTGGGSVVNISSRAAEFAGHGRMPMSVAKAALEHLTRLMAQELSPQIRVNAIGLGSIMTPGLEGYFQRNPSLRDELFEVIPLRRGGDAEDVGLAVLYLCSKGCYATGAILHLDGGIQTAPSNMIRSASAGV
jgi:NAD(P)-dependent dehydrogenase (short-subunit alcohol dehydrogenase family)